MMDAPLQHVVVFVEVLSTVSKRLNGRYTRDHLGVDL